MNKEWTVESIKELSNVELRNLFENAERLRNMEVQDICAKEMADRPGFTKRRNSPSIRAADLKVVDSFQKLSIKANSLFDLSDSTAKSLSANTKGFRAHRFSAKGGKPKIGGKKKSGEMKFDYYVSYRLCGKAAALATYLNSDGTVDDVYYTIKISAALVHEVEGYTAAAELKEYVEGTVYRFGKVFSSFENAEREFLQLLNTFAPQKITPKV